MFPKIKLARQRLNISNMEIPISYDTDRQFKWNDAAHQTSLKLNMLNYFKDYKRHIHILNHILDLAWSK